MDETEMKHEKKELAYYQSCDLRVKLLLTRQRVRDWINVYGTDSCCVRMTLSPESLVLLHIVKEFDPHVPVFFSEQEGYKEFTAWMASEDETGVDDWLRYGCNQYDTQKPESRPMAFWLKEDVFQYLKEHTEEK